MKDYKHGKQVLQRSYLLAAAVGLQIHSQNYKWVACVSSLRPRSHIHDDVVNWFVVFFVHTIKSRVCLPYSQDVVEAQWSFFAWFVEKNQVLFLVILNSIFKLKKWILGRKWWKNKSVEKDQCVWRSPGGTAAHDQAVPLVSVDSAQEIHAWANLLNKSEFLSSCFGQFESHSSHVLPSSLLLWELGKLPKRSFTPPKLRKPPRGKLVGWADFLGVV